ncbi:putative quinol monooxygenase [Halorarum halobium]|uniref:putative quinol monooxygenase n=1 Tax=Halorarum halobium TaxID=3075121 RepID=UPI0028AD5E9E|nr:putative quinol monooxygenase [Halobaculum sp. XH14]
MFVVHTSIPIDPERREEAIAHVASMVEDSRAEDGTVRYRAMEDLTEPNVVRFFEQYEDVAAAERHTNSERYREFVEALPAFSSGALETIQFETDEFVVHEFEASEAVESVE